jgi:threonine dehydrogenase-like Zn-dependent dehydrogenase
LTAGVTWDDYGLAVEREFIWMNSYEAAMKTLVLASFGRIVVEERPEPVPEADDVLIRIVATGICGSDIHGYTGENGRRVPGQIMGHETAGVVAALGPGVSRPDLRVGTPVTINPVVIPAADLERFAGREQHHPHKSVVGVDPAVSSAFAQLVSMPERNVVALPDDLPVVHGALVEPLAVAVHAVRRVGVRPNDSVLVVGGGPIGQSVVLALQMAGVKRFVVSEVEPARRALIERLGAPAIDPAAESIAASVAAVLGGPADVAIDAVGLGPTLADALSATRLGGSVCLVGMGAVRLPIDAFRVSTEERSIIGSFTYSGVDFRDAASWIAEVPQLAAALITREVPLDQADDAFRGLAAGDGTAGKVLIRMDRETETRPSPGRRLASHA